MEKIGDMILLEKTEYKHNHQYYKISMDKLRTDNAVASKPFIFISHSSNQPQKKFLPPIWTEEDFCDLYFI